MQYVEQERFMHLRDLVHAFEVEGLEASEGEGVVDVVEERPERPAFDPFLEGGPEPAVQHVGQRQKPPLLRLYGVEVFDLFVEIALVLAGHASGARLDQHLHKREEKLEIVPGRLERKGVDREAASIQANKQ